MMKSYYADEKLYMATLILAKGTDTLQQRLDDAYISSLNRMFSPTHFPDDDLYRKFTELLAEFESLRSTADGLINMTDDKAQQFAERIVGLFWNVAKAQGRAEC